MLLGFEVAMSYLVATSNHEEKPMLTAPRHALDLGPTAKGSMRSILLNCCKG